MPSLRCLEKSEAVGRRGLRKVIHLCSASVVYPGPSVSRTRGEVTFPVPSKSLFVNGPRGLNLAWLTGWNLGGGLLPAAERTHPEHMNTRSQPIPCRGNLLLLLSVLWWLIAVSRFKKSHLSGSLRGRKEVRAKSSDWLPGFGNLKRARIFRPTSIELPSTRKGPKWRAKVCGCPHRAL